MRSARLVGGLIVILSVAVGCATAPIQEMSDARQALGAAREAGALSHAPESLAIAQTQLDRAEQALRQGEFDEARASAKSALEEAVRARNMAAAIGAAKALLAKAGALGCACHRIRELIREAEAAVRLGDEETAVELAGKASRRAERVVKGAAGK